VPALEQEALPFDLLEILARAQERARLALGNWRARDLELEPELGDLQQRAVAATLRLNQAEALRDAALEEHEGRTADENDHLARLQTTLEDTPTPEALRLTLVEPERAPREPERQPAPAAVDVTWRGIGPFVYWPLIALITVGEIPLNAFAFRLFHESDLLTYVLTVTVAVGLVAFAHGLGLLLARDTRTRVERVLVGVFAVLPIAVIGVIALVRYGYLVEVGGDVGLGPVLGALAFGLINLLVFGAAAGLSFLHHDPHTLASRKAAIRAAERERAHAERRSEERERALRGRELARLRERHQAELEARRREGSLRSEQVASAIEAIRRGGRERLERLGELEAKVEAALTEAADARRQVDRVVAERKGLREAIEAELAAIRSHRDRLFYTYCSANVRARKGHDTPACLQEVPALEVPEGFREPVVRAA
jgi:hypothetical protein